MYEIVDVSSHYTSIKVIISDLQSEKQNLWRSSTEHFRFALYWGEYSNRFAFQSIEHLSENSCCGIYGCKIHHALILYWKALKAICLCVFFCFFLDFIWMQTLTQKPFCSRWYGIIVLRAYSTHSFMFR